MRAGTWALTILTYALSARVLRAHVDGPLRPGELDDALGWAPQSSLRAAVAKLCEAGALHRVQTEVSSSRTATELTPAGQELLPVADALEGWLRFAPGGPIGLDDEAAHGTVKVLVAGWDSTMIRALAQRPMTLATLSTAIPELNYPALKRRLAKLRATGLVEPVGSGRVRSYVATEWLRRAVVPLALAGSWEERHGGLAEPVSQVEVEAAFLLALGLVEVPAVPSGACTLSVRLANGEVPGIGVEVQDGRLACSAPPVTGAVGWALGPSDAWFEALIHDGTAGLRIGGEETGLVESLLDGLRAVFANIMADGGGAEGRNSAELQDRAPKF